MAITDKLTYDQFVGRLRSALHYLYDPVHLRRSPLVQLLDLDGAFDTAAALQQALVAAIGALKPADDEPPQSRAWRIYDLLNFHFVRQLTGEAVAMQLGVSERQLRREQRLAIEALGQHLWQEPPLVRRQALSQPGEPGLKPEPDHALSEELVWLQTPAPEQRIPLGEALQDVCGLALPLAQQWQASLELDVQAELTALPVTQLALRSILVTVLTVAIPRAGRGPVLLSAAQDGADIKLSVTCRASDASQAPLSDRDAAGLETAQTVAAFYGAQLSFPPQTTAGFGITLTLPAPKQLPVLVVDDNADWIELLKRYAAGSRYQIVGTREPGSARSLAEKVQPAVILLDVMMHNVDGWQLLSELRHDPATSSIPVIVCTILPVEGMALSLGANAFLQKPVTQEQLLKALEQQQFLPDQPAPTHPALV